MRDRPFSIKRLKTKYEILIFSLEPLYACFLCACRTIDFVGKTVMPVKLFFQCNGLVESVVYYSLNAT